MREKDFNYLSETLIAYTDLLKWTSSLGEGFVEQMTVPTHGATFTIVVSNLFQLAITDKYPLIVSSPDETRWLQHLPLQAAFIGFNDGIILVTKKVSLDKDEFPSLALSIPIYTDEARKVLQESKMLGFAHQDAKNALTLINAYIPIYDPSNYMDLVAQNNADFNSSIFS